ncbi:MAG: hypothetical protein IPO07_04730 [Haliscomenobacter sp.]|nr:hypothetical protein [Haliscomenobacter sp.]MBK9488168.1 hypothetical protein [Haliscomenobacter sp.]
MELWIAVRDGRYVEEGKLGQYILPVDLNTWRDELRKRRTRPLKCCPMPHSQIADEGAETLASAIVKIVT